MFMLGYKMNKVFGRESIDYLSDRYLDSDYLYEMGRGELDPHNPMR
jgi:thymidylate kinase